MGAALGFVMGIAFLILSLLQYDDEVTNAKDVALVSVLFGIPFAVLIGLAVGWAWGRLFGTDSLS
jgi:NhaP-type Na+/H+ or K+/H+ antiporter